MWASILAFIMDIVKLFVNKPAPVVTEARDAAAAETNLATETKANVEVQSAVEASRAADVRDADPGQLRNDDGFERK